LHRQNMKSEEFQIPCLEHGFLPIDIRLSRFLENLDRHQVPGLALAAAMASRANREGHVCLDLGRYEAVSFPDEEEPLRRLVLPDRDKWIEALGSSRVVGCPGEKKPLVLDAAGRLYLYRYWEYENLLARLILDRVKNPPPVLGDPLLLRRMLDSLYPDTPDNGIDRQKLAVFSTAVNRFSVISGGPGTGKTFTASRALALLAGWAGSGTEGRIALAAPTGKAAARLGETMALAKQNLPISKVIKDRIPIEASTVHRLLGSVPHSPYFRHNSENPLQADVLLVDEASMMSLALLSKLIQALPPDARVILLGDRDQLASVEAGAVLGDICDTGQRHLYSSGFAAAANTICGIRFEEESDPSLKGPVVQDSMVELRKSRRFTEGSGIGAVGRAVNSGDGRSALQIMTDSGHADIRWEDLPAPSEIGARIRETILPWLESLRKVMDPDSVFTEFGRFRIICALRAGPYGAASINVLVDSLFRRRKGPGPGFQAEPVPGQPILVTKNDYRLRLFNGDIGLVLPDSLSGGELRVFFPLPDRTFRRIHPAALPSHESAWALTVHKSQGSEFDRVLLILPDRDSPVLTRELVYTGLTRARDRVTVWGKNHVFLQAVLRRTVRMSGLRDALWADVG